MRAHHTLWLVAVIQVIALYHAAVAVRPLGLVQHGLTLAAVLYLARLAR